MPRRAARARLAALSAALTAALSGCAEAAPLAPGAGTGIDAGGGTGRGTGTSGGGGAAAALVGSWRAGVVIQTDTDISITHTTWTFRADGSCARMRETRSAVEDVPRSETRECRFTAGADLGIAWSDGGTVAFAYGFPAFAPDRLTLDGLTYERVADPAP
jgi:hypothetical protein